MYFPTKKANKHTKDFLQEFYKQCKFETIQQLSGFLKIRIDFKEMKKNLMNYNFIREKITDKALLKFRSCGEVELKQLAAEIDYSLNLLLNHISYELAQSYIRENELANERLRYLSNWIFQFGYLMKTNTINQGYDKQFVNFIDQYVRGIDQASGPKNYDYFEDYIEEAYQNSLLLNKIKKTNS